MDDPWTQLIEKGFDAFHITSFHNSGWFENPKQTSSVSISNIWKQKHKAKAADDTKQSQVTTFLFSCFL